MLTMSLLVHYYIHIDIARLAPLPLWVLTISYLVNMIPPPLNKLLLKQQHCQISILPSPFPSLCYENLFL